MTFLQGRNGKARWTARVVLLAALLLGLPAQGWARCMSLMEANAEYVRGLQSALMVAALKCVHRPELGAYDKYNQFVSRFDRELIAHSNVLQKYFRDTYGAQHRFFLNKYVTRLANDFSLRTFESPEFCDQMTQIADELLADGEGAVLHMRFDRSFLPPLTEPLCESRASRDFPALNGTVPDLISIHMPDIDLALKRKRLLEPSLVPPMPAE